MNLTNHPELLERLASAYALGTLRGGARRRFEAIARQNPAVRTAALLWQERFAAMTELQAGQAPGPNVWKRIENQLDRPALATAAPASQPWWRSLGLWRGTGILGSAMALGVLVLTVNANRELAARDQQLAQAQVQGRQLAQQNAQLVAQLQAQPEIRYVAVLADERGPSVLATFDPKHSTLTLKRVGGFQEAADKSLQLWALPEGGSPRSLGVLPGERIVKLAAVEQQMQQSPALAISLEPKGGVPSETGPTGPVLFKGAVLQTPL